MNFKDRITKKYKIQAAGMKDLVIDIDTYLDKHPDDQDYLVDMSHSKEHFLNDPAVKKIAQKIDKNLSPDWLYGIITKK